MPHLCVVHHFQGFCTAVQWFVNLIASKDYRLGTVYTAFKTTAHAVVFSSTEAVIHMYICTELILHDFRNVANVH